MAYNFKNLADVELLNAMPEEANMLVEVNGTTKRAPQVKAENGDSGGGKMLIIKGSDFDNSVAGVAVAASAPEETYAANMTFDEVMTAFAAGEPIEGFVFMGGGYPKQEKITTVILNTSDQPFPVLYFGCSYGTFVWPAIGDISIT